MSNDYYILEPEEEQQQNDEAYALYLQELWEAEQVEVLEAIEWNERKVA